MINDPSSSPVIIGPAEHNITTDLIDPDALFVLRKLNKAGYSGYLVGGGVRDLFLGKTPKDFDIGTDARPGQVRQLFSNSRTIGRRFRLVQVFFKHGKIIEVSTLRSLSEHDIDGPETVLAPNNTYGTVSEDAQRRDISINALFYEIGQQTIIDHVGGFDDLQKGIVRIIGDPIKRINRDPVRMMRVIRHASRNNFTIETRSWQAVCANSNRLSLCPPSRLRDETLKDIYGGSSADWFNLAERSGIFGRLFPVYRGRDNTVSETDRQALTTLFNIIDRLNNTAMEAGCHRQPEHVLLALILLPWAKRNFNLADATLKGRRVARLTIDIRDTLNKTLGPTLNLTRSSRQEISTLLGHLPNFFAQQDKHNWPKWLKQKSYFRTCCLLYHCSTEAATGVPVPEELFVSPEQFSGHRQSGKSKGHQANRKGRPAVVGNRPGGIFGFKR